VGIDTLLYSIGMNGKDEAGALAPGDPFQGQLDEGDWSWPEYPAATR